MITLGPASPRPIQNRATSASFCSPLILSISSVISSRLGSPGTSCKVSATSLSVALPQGSEIAILAGKQQLQAMLVRLFRQREVRFGLHAPAPCTGCLPPRKTRGRSQRSVNHYRPIETRRSARATSFPLKWASSTVCRIAALIITNLPDCISTSDATCAAISADNRAGYVAQPSPSCRARRNTCASAQVLRRCFDRPIAVNNQPSGIAGLLNGPARQPRIAGMFRSPIPFITPPALTKAMKMRVIKLIAVRERANLIVPE